MQLKVSFSNKEIEDVIINKSIERLEQEIEEENLLDIDLEVVKKLVIEKLAVKFSNKMQSEQNYDDDPWLNAAETFILEKVAERIKDEDVKKMLMSALINRLN